MAHIKEIPKAVLIIGIMHNDSEIFKKNIGLLTKRFGNVFDKLEYDFDFTDYYNKETGDGLKKILLVFSESINREELVEIKHLTNEIEDNCSSDGNRKINIDPGYMTPHNVILASAKEMPHKIYIGKGMFGDVVLIFKNKRFMHSDHTYPDYKSDNVKDFLTKTRNILMDKRILMERIT